MGCLTCTAPTPIARTGRPPLYCGAECRREMGRLRRSLSELEGEVLEAREKHANGFWPGSEFWGRTASDLEADIALLRARIPEELQ